MKRTWLLAVGPLIAGLLSPPLSALSAPVEDTGLRTCWDSSGNQIACSGTGQDGELRRGVEWPTPRFTANGDGTVTDNLTDLLWLANADCFGRRHWAQALAETKNLSSGSDQCGLTDGSDAGDWRVPNIKELLSLVDYSQASPAMPPGHPFTNVQGSFYLSSTSLLPGGTSSAVIYMGNGFDSFGGKGGTHYSWPVRDRDAHPPPQGGSDPMVSAEGLIESTSGGFLFPDGTAQTRAAGAGAAPVDRTGQKRCWDTSGNLISCVGTSQDGDLQRGAVWPTPRFTRNGDGTVTDHLTHLIWLELANCFGPRTWEQALTDCRTLATGQCGLSDGSQAGDWRLPSIKELFSLVDYSQISPALPPGYPFSSVQSAYHSSTSYALFENLRWGLHIGFGSDIQTAKSNATEFAWPVRGGR